MKSFLQHLKESEHAPGVEHVAGWLADRLRIPVGEITSSISKKLDGSQDFSKIESAFHSYIEDHPAVQRLAGRDGRVKLNELENDLKQDASHMMDKYYSSK